MQQISADQNLYSFKHPQANYYFNSFLAMPAVLFRNKLVSNFSETICKVLYCYLYSKRCKVMTSFYSSNRPLIEHLLALSIAGYGNKLVSVCSCITTIVFVTPWNLSDITTQKKALFRVTHGNSYAYPVP